MLNDRRWNRQSNNRDGFPRSLHRSAGRDRLNREISGGSRPLLRRGAKGSAVLELQRRLKTLRFDPGSIDGIFGPATESMVRAFQKARNLASDGVVGQQTWAALETVAPVTPSPPSMPSRPWLPPSVGAGGRTIQLEVPFYGYQDNDKAGCFRRSCEMAAAVGVQVGGPDARIQVATREDAHGRITVDPAKAREGRDYIDVQLEAGRPVVVGVSYMDADYNVDDITDHFVTITGRGTLSDHETFYGFHDPASSYASKGSDKNIANRFYIMGEDALFRPAASSAPLGDHIYDVSMVRRNI